MGKIKKIKLKKNDSIDNETGIILFFYPLVQAIIGLILLLPPIIGVFLFICNLFGMNGSIVGLSTLDPKWTARETGMSAAPIYLGMMALAGAYLVNNAYKNFTSAMGTISGINSIESIELSEVEDKKE